MANMIQMRVGQEHPVDRLPSAQSDGSPTPVPASIRMVDQQGRSSQVFADTAAAAKVRSEWPLFAVELVNAVPIVGWRSLPEFGNAMEIIPV